MDEPLHRASDAELLRRTAREPEAFGVFYERHVAQMLAFVRRRTGQPDVALDVCAELFARALAASGRYVGDDPADAWLYRIARNLLVDLYRSGRTEDTMRRALGMEPIVLTDEGLERVEALAASAASPVLDALDDLPDDMRDAVRARVLDEREYREIAGTLVVSESVVRRRVSRGLAHLRTRLEQSP
jgi:RNA polymerase sigma factor (sigma-70 family)